MELLHIAMDEIVNGLLCVYVRVAPMLSKDGSCSQGLCIVVGVDVLGAPVLVAHDVPYAS